MIKIHIMWYLEITNARYNKKNNKKKKKEEKI